MENRIMNAHPGSPINSNLNVLWFLPTHGDSRYLGTAVGGRQVGLRYLRQIAQAADELGYFGVLLPTGRSCEDSWIVASALAPLTERRGAHDGNARSAFRRPASDQCRDRRRSDRECRRRHLPVA
jgi:hypothetical protein